MSRVTVTVPSGTQPEPVPAPKPVTKPRTTKKESSENG